MAKPLRKFLISHSVLMFGREVFGLFVSLHIWKMTDSLSDVALFQLVTIWAHLLTFTCSAFLVKKGYVPQVRLIGIFGSVAFFITIFLLGDHAIFWLLPLAVFNGAFGGMYWIVYHTLYLDLPTVQNRAYFASLDRSARILISVLAPAFGGLIISINAFDLGYEVIFIVGAICYSLSAAIGDVRTPKVSTSHYHFRKTLGLMWQQKPLVRAITARLMSNMWYQGALEKIIPIFIFEVVGNTLDLGLGLSMLAVLSIVVTMIFGRYIPQRQYLLVTSISVGIVFIGFLCLIGVPGIWAYLAFVLVREVFAPLINIPCIIYSDNLVRQLPDYENHRTEYIVIKEWLILAVGRTSGFLCLYFATDMEMSEVQWIFVLSGLSLLMIPFLIRAIVGHDRPEPLELSKPNNDRRRSGSTSSQAKSSM